MTLVRDSGNEGELFIVISPSSPDPMYKQITDQIKDAIASGTLSPSSQLPSIREMADILKISAITIKRAYQDLESQGLIVTRAGLGSFVSDLSHADLRQEKEREIAGALRTLIEAARKYGISTQEFISLVDREVKNGN